MLRILGPCWVWLLGYYWCCWRRSYLSSVWYRTRTTSRRWKLSHVSHFFVFLLITGHLEVLIFSVWILLTLMLHKINSGDRFSKPYIFAIQYRWPKIFQTMNSVGSNNLSLKYLRLAPLVSKYMGIRTFGFGLWQRLVFSIWVC